MGSGGPWFVPLRVVSGFLDAAGGGSWGPVSAPTLLSTGRIEPRKVIGPVDTSELLIGLTVGAGFPPPTAPW